MTKWIAALIVAAALSGILNMPKTLRAHARGVDWVRAEKASWQTSARRARRMTWTCERRAGLRRSGWPTVPWRLNTQARHRAVLHYWRSRHAACHALSASSVPAIICRVFGPYCSQATAVSRCETGGTFSVNARNGQYLGLFQMGSYARGRYGHSSTALGQARAAYRYFAASGYDWSPWSCKP